MQYSKLIKSLSYPFNKKKIINLYSLRSNQQNCEIVTFEPRVIQQDIFIKIMLTRRITYGGRWLASQREMYTSPNNAQEYIILFKPNPTYRLIVFVFIICSLFF